MFKIIHRYFRSRWERFYLRNHWHLVLDLTLIIVVVCLVITVIVLFLYKPNPSDFGSNIRPVVDLNNPPLSLEIIADEKAVGMNEAVPVKIVFNNSGAAAITDLTISLEMSDDNFILKKIEKAADNSRFTVNNQSLSFAALAAGTSGEADFKVYFSAKGASRSINWRARSEYSLNNQIIKHDFYLPSLKTKAEITVQGAAYYTSPQGDQLGIGPLPPLVGIPTNYWIFWEAQSQTDWKNLIISARLPKGVELTDSRSLLAGEFNYNPETRQLIWKVPEFLGRDESYHLGFEIQLIPTASQVGEVLTLLGDAKYYATDILTGEEASGVLEKLTTNLDKDRFNSGNGQVVSE
jgi:hypothetical protein